MILWDRDRYFNVNFGAGICVVHCSAASDRDVTIPVRAGRLHPRERVLCCPTSLTTMNNHRCDFSRRTYIFQYLKCLVPRDGGHFHDVETLFEQRTGNFAAEIVEKSRRLFSGFRFRCGLNGLILGWIKFHVDHFFVKLLRSTINCIYDKSGNDVVPDVP